MIDPFNPAYYRFDKLAKQQAWTRVEDNFNCSIEVVAYPLDAEWGTPRWNYILNQAAGNTSDYDFYKVPDSKIRMFVEGNALLDLTDRYETYGIGLLDDIYIQSRTYGGKLYSLPEKSQEIYNVIYYNIGLLHRLRWENPLQKCLMKGIGRILHLKIMRLQLKMH